MELCYLCPQQTDMITEEIEKRAKLMKVFKIAIYAMEFIKLVPEFSIFWLPWHSWWGPSWCCWSSGWNEGIWCYYLWRFPYPCRNQYNKTVLSWKMSLIINILSKYLYALNRHWSHNMTIFHIVCYWAQGQIFKLRFFQCVYLNNHTLFKIDNWFMVKLSTLITDNFPHVQFL